MFNQDQITKLLEVQNQVIIKTVDEQMSIAKTILTILIIQIAFTLLSASP